MKGIILKKVPYGESDLIIHWLLESGVMASSFAAGGRKSKRRFPHQFHLAGIYRLEFTHSLAQDRLVRLHSAELLELHQGLTHSLENLCRWAFIVEWIALHRDTPFDFQNLQALMKDLSSLASRDRFLGFLMEEIRIHGWMPELEICVLCEQPVEKNHAFSFSDGGLVHAAHGSFIPLSREDLEALRDLASPTMSQRHTLNQKHHLDPLLVSYLECQFGSSLKSGEYFKLESADLNFRQDKLHSPSP